MKKLLIIGSGDLGQQLAHHIILDKQYIIVGFADDFRDRGTLVKGLPVLGGLDEIETLYKSGRIDSILIAIGYKHMEFRRKIYEKFVDFIPFASYIHPSSIVDETSSVGKGVIVLPGCLIDQQVVIEDNVLLNVGCCIAHDSVVGKHSFLSPRVAVAGFTKIGERCVIGINSTLIDNLVLTDGVQIGAGAVVIKHIEKPGLYVGNPTKFIR